MGASTSDRPRLIQERGELLRQLHVLNNQKDGIDAAISARKLRLEAVMNLLGDGKVKSEFDGSASFTTRNNFAVTSTKLLAERCTKAFLAEGFVPTAGLVKALTQKGVSIEGMLSQGTTESFAYRRPSTKDAVAIQKQMIEETQARAEEYVVEMMRTLEKED